MNRIKPAGYPLAIKPTNLDDQDLEPGSFVGSGLGRALMALSPKGLRAAQSGGKEPGATKRTRKGPPV